MVTPAPPDPFEPDIEDLEFGTLVYRVHHNRRAGAEFNPGHGASTRFAFFDDADGALVPVLYCAETEAAAVAETLLHDVPVAGGFLLYDDYAPKVMSRLRLTRPLRVAVLHGLGLRRLGVRAEQVTASPSSTYSATVAWAEAVHASGVDGLVWMSRQSNDAKAYAFFGDRCGDAFEQDDGFGRLFATGADLLWLIDLCAPLRVHVLPPSPG